MALIKLNEWERTFEDDYREYLASRPTLNSERFRCEAANDCFRCEASSERYRSEGETIFDVLASPEADFTADEEGRRIVEILHQM